MGLLAGLVTRAQSSFPFPDSAAMWVQYWEFMVTEPPLPVFEVMGTSNICITGEDTLINGVVFTKVGQCNADYVGALREVHGRVEFIPADSTQAYLLYDFSLALGDTAHGVFVDEELAFQSGFSTPALVSYIVIETGQVEGRKWLRLQQLWGGPDQIWIEGFGSPYGLFSTQNPANISGTMSGIWCMSHRDTAWYFSEWEVDHIPGAVCTPQYVGIQERDEHAVVAYPNPTSGHVRLRTDGIMHDSVRVTDQFGRELVVPVRPAHGYIEIDLTGLAAGMYFVRSSNSVQTVTTRILKQ